LGQSCKTYLQGVDDDLGRLTSRQQAEAGLKLAHRQLMADQKVDERRFADHLHYFAVSLPPFFLVPASFVGIA